MSIGRNTAVGMATNIVVFGLGILVSIVLTRSLGPGQRGVYALLVATGLVLTNLAHLNLWTSCSTMLAQGRYRLGEVNTVAIGLSLVMGAVSLLLTALAYPLLSGNVFQGVSFGHLLVALLLIPAMIYQICWNAMMMGLNRVVLLNQLNLVVNIGSATLMIVAVGVLHAGIPGFLAAWATSTTVAALAAFVLAWRMERPARPRPGAIRAMVTFGLRGHGANIAQQLFLRLDVYLVNPMVGLTGVGFYSLSTSLAEKMWVPLNAIHTASLGKIAQLPHDESALLTAKVTRAALLMMASLALPFAAVSPWLIPFLYGSEFGASVVPLVILLVGTLGFAAMLVLNSYIMGQMQRPGLLSIISWAELGVSVPLYVIFISAWGIIGAAVASTLTYLLAMVATLSVFVRDSHLPLSRVLIARPDDFREYWRLIRSGILRVPLLRRYTRQTP